MHNSFIRFTFTINMLVVVVVQTIAPQASARVAGTGLELAIEATLLLRSNDLDEALLGSGFGYSTSGIALTNAHVVKGASTVLAISADGTREIARVVGVDQLRDVAVLRLEPNNRTALPPQVDGPRVGQTVYAIGAPFEADFSLTRGIISALGRQIDPSVPIRMLQHDAPVNPGSSGGPLVNSEGQLLGMNSQIADGARHFVGISYAIPAHDLDEIVNAILNGGLVVLPKLGMRVRPISPKIAVALEVPANQGVLIDHVQKDGVADQAGLRVGDILLQIDMQEILKVGDIAFAFARLTGFDQFALEVSRAGVVLQLSMLIATNETALRAKPSRAAPKVIKSYSMSTLGISIGDDGTITQISEMSPAHYEGLAEGDRLIAVNGRVMDESFDAQNVRTAEVTKPILLLVLLSDGSTKHIVIDPWQTGRKLRPVNGANILDSDVVVF